MIRALADDFALVGVFLEQGNATGCSIKQPCIDFVLCMAGGVLMEINMELYITGFDRLLLLIRRRSLAVGQGYDIA